MLTIQMMDLSAPRHHKSEEEKQCRICRQRRRGRGRDRDRDRGVRRSTNSCNVR